MIDSIEYINDDGSISKEIWKDVLGYEDYYQISDLGRIKSLDRLVLRKDRKITPWKGKLLSLRFDKDGYALVTLSKDNKIITPKIHRLVAQAFIPNPENKPQVNHKDFIKHNNKLDNLEWTTPKENEQHKIINNKRNMPYGENCHASSLTNKEVLEIREKLKIKGLMQKDIAIEYNVDSDVISGIKLGRHYNKVK